MQEFFSPLVLRGRIGKFPRFTSFSHFLSSEPLPFAREGTRVIARDRYPVADKGPSPSPIRIVKARSHNVGIFIFSTLLRASALRALIAERN